MPDQSTEALPTAPAPSASRPVTLLNGPDPAAAAAAAAATKTRDEATAASSAALAADSIRDVGFANPISLERPDPAVSTPARRAAGNPAEFGSVAAPGDNPFQVHLEAQGGPAPVGSSLLAVLASYVLPGGGSLPIRAPCSCSSSSR